MSLAGGRGMKLAVQISRQRLLRAFAAVQRRKALEEAERAGWPLPVELSLHLQLSAWGLRH